MGDHIASEQWEWKGPEVAHTPTRVDIRTEGWTSGTDMPLPRQCQTALCHHREHQLGGGRLLPDSAWCPPTGVDNSALEIPTVSIRRGGLRHWPMLPNFETRVWRKRRWHRWRVEARVYTGQPWQYVASWRRWQTACDHANMIEQLNQDVYTRIKDHVTQHG